MAKLSQLEICGIRSFGPRVEHVQCLKFDTPLTLILGENGCGKTSIIEALTYVCTGDLPAGTNSGQGFVNDPKMTRSFSTKGQIKLKIIDPAKNEVTMIRVVEAVQNISRISFACKNATIRIAKPNQEPTSISGRCADVSAECCRIMNVSASVLNNVIFCHQENSAWPLDEGKKVKERFDEIFEAQRYNKCAESLRKEIKLKKDQVKYLSLELKNKKEKKELVDQNKRRLEDKQDQKIKLSEQIETKNEELEPIVNRIKEICILENQLGTLQAELSTKEETKKGLIDHQNSLKASIKFIFEGDDSDLRQDIESFEENQQKNQLIIGELEKRKNDIDQKAKLMLNTIQQTQQKIGMLNKEKEHQLSKISLRKDLLEKAKTRMNITTFTNHEDPKSTLNELKTALVALQSNLDKFIEAKDVEADNCQILIDTARENTVRTTQKIASTNNELKEMQAKLRKVTNELNHIASSDDCLKSISLKLESTEKTIKDLTGIFNETQESQKVQNFKQEQLEEEHQLEQLEQDHRILQKNDILEGKIEAEMHSILSKKKEITRIKNKHAVSLTELFKNGVPEENFKTAVSRILEKEEKSVEDLLDKINAKQKVVTTLQMQHQHQKENETTYRSELTKKEASILQVCNGRDFHQTLTSTRTKKEQLQLDKGHFSSVKIIYERFLKDFTKTTPCCPVCETDFSQKKQAVSKIISTIQTKIQKVPTELATVEEALQKEEQTYSRLQQLQLVNEEIEVLSNVKIPMLEEEIAETKQKLDSETSELESLKKQLVHPKKIVQISRSIISDLGNLDQQQLEVRKAEQNVDYLKQNLVTVESNKSKHVVESEIDEIKADIAELGRKVEAQRKKMDNHRTKLQQLIQEKSTLLSQQMELKEGIQSKPNLEAQQTELREKVEKVTEELSNLEATQNFLEDELSVAVANREELVKKNKQIIATEQNKVANNRKMVDEVQILQQEIDAYINKGTDQIIVNVEAELKELNGKNDTLEITKNKVIQAILDKKDEASKQEIHFRTLKDNVLLREKIALEKSLRLEISELKKQIGGYNYTTVFEEKRRLKAQNDETTARINTLKGEVATLSSVITELQTDLALPANKNAHKDYMDKLYELKVITLTVQDITLYANILEKAILEFHKGKMVQINKNIRDLWRQIYRGNDIDSIEIKTEHATGTSTKRTYNYKVVQMKRGVELDMRGRCSAGQRVLACLIIRMALAQTLSANCGILALDEPTTNLDRENISSLSDALARIVESRHHEKNFQLLIITHDEQFLSNLSRAVGVGHYNRVSRDREGFSVITTEQAL